MSADITILLKGAIMSIFHREKIHDRYQINAKKVVCTTVRCCGHAVNIRLTVGPVNFVR